MLLNHQDSEDNATVSFVPNGPYCLKVHTRIVLPEPNLSSIINGECQGIGAKCEGVFAVRKRCPEPLMSCCN
jgi:hypothetical protein